jgi:molecular chaperone GrpE
MQSSRASEGGEQAVEQQVPEDQRSGEGSDQPHGNGASEQVQAELAAMEDRYKRALADLDNYRKRSAREADRRVAESREALLREWLEAVDSVERAMWMERESPMSEGLRAVLDQMESILARQGVARIGSTGEPFDPALHEAVGVRSSNEVPDRTIVDVARSGFGLGDRVLRPAQVIVSRREEPGDRED